MDTVGIALDHSPTPHRDRAYWQAQFDSWQSSGLSKAAFCRQEAVKVTTFYYWCGVFGSRVPKHSTESAALNPSFLPVTLHREPASVMTIQLADVTVSCHQLIPADQLGAWISAIRRTL